MPFNTAIEYWNLKNMKFICLIKTTLALATGITFFMTGCSNGNSGAASSTPILEKKGEYILTGFSSNMAVSNNTAIIAHTDDSMTEDGIYFIDISTPGTPQQTGILETEDVVASVAIYGEKVYFTQREYHDGSWGGLLKEVPLSDREIVRTLSTDYIPNSFVLNGEYGYLLDYKGIHIIDMDTFAILKTVGSLSSYMMTIDHARAYVAGQYHAIDVFDISYPGSPQLLGSFTNPYDSAPHDIKASENIVALAAGGYGTLLFDASDPASIELIDIHETGDWAEGLAVDDHYTYLADGDAGLVVIDTSNIASPVVKETYSLGDYAREVIVIGNYVYVLLNGKGLVIFEKTK
ncbi:MAG: hypothetical protein KJ737_25450 [Proteobacteria bacterium]|nr:hypothetical protein [Pseudomonadota bacterium]